MQETRSLLEHAQAQGMWRKELKQIYNVLSELRAKLRPFCLGISVSTSGSAYALVSLPASEQETHVAVRVPDRRLYCKNSSEPKGAVEPSCYEQRQPRETGV